MGSKVQGSTADKVDHCGHPEDVLVVARKEEDPVRSDGPAHRAAELVLAVVRLEVEECGPGAERAVAREVEGRAVQVIGSGLGHYVHDGATGSTKFRAVRV